MYKPQITALKGSYMCVYRTLQNSDKPVYYLKKIHNSILKIKRNL